MRNLKKLLSLALALVMMLGMLTVAAAADEEVTGVTDLEECMNPNAVQLLLELGTVTGKPGNVFDPKGDITKAEFAALLYRVLTGTNDADAYKGGSTLKDVAGHWAEGQINYIVSLKIASGDTDGNFLPAKNVSTVEAGKMLLTTLGWDADREGYQNNPAWSVNIMRDAQDKGLLSGLPSGSAAATHALTRDEAVQMVFNALFVKGVRATVERDMGEWYISGYTSNVATLGLSTYGLVKVTASVGENFELTVTGVAPNPSSTIPSTFSAVASDLKDAAEDTFTFASNMIGKNISFYAILGYNGNITYDKFVKILGVDPVLAPTTVLASTYKAFTWNDSISYTGNTVATTASAYIATLEGAGALADVDYYLNGVKADGTSLTAAAVQTAAIKAGVLVEFIDTDSPSDGKANIVAVTQKVPVALTDDVATRTSGGKLQVRVPGLNAVTNLAANIGGTFVDAENVVGYEGLVKGDVVLYYSIAGTTYIEKAEFVEGVAASRTNAGLRIGGTVYPQSGLLASTILGGSAPNDAVSTWTDFSNTYNFFLDDGKNIIAVDSLTAITTTTYAVLLDSGFVGTGTDIGGTSYAQAKLLFTDGTVEVVKWDMVVAADGTYSRITTASGAEDTGKAGTAADPNLIKLTSGVAAAGGVGHFVTYTVDADGFYTLKAIASGSKTAIDPEAAVTNNKVAFVTGAVGNANTVFIIGSKVGSTVSYKVYTGIANVPSLTTTAGTGGGEYIKNSSGVATYVYINADNTLSGSVGEYVYVTVNPQTAYEFYPAASGVAAHRVYKAFVNGVEEEIKIAETLSAFFGDATSYRYKLLKVSAKDGNGIITAFDSASPGLDKLVAGSVRAASGGVLVTHSTTTGTGGTDTVYTYDSETKVIQITKDGSTYDVNEVSMRTFTTGTGSEFSAIKIFVDASGSANYISTIYVYVELS